MKKLILLVSSIIIKGCTSSGYNGSHDVDWVEPIIFQQNLRDCRSATVCRAENLFKLA